MLCGAEDGAPVHPSRLRRWLRRTDVYSNLSLKFTKYIARSILLLSDAALTSLWAPLSGPELSGIIPADDSFCSTIHG